MADTLDNFVQENATMHQFSDTVFVLDQETVFVSDSDEEPDDTKAQQSDDELNKLEAELQQAKHELNGIVDSHNDQTLKFQSMLDKVQNQSENIGIIKEKQKQRSSIKKIQTNYQNELQQINNKLQQTQNSHMTQIQKLKKNCNKLKLNTKIKDAKITELTKENVELNSKLSQIKNTNENEMQNIRKEYDDRIEAEINKRITQISQLKQQKNAEIDALNRKLQKQNIATDSTAQNSMNENEKDELINNLKEEIQRLERQYEEEQDMFFKHSEIFDHKLERETKEKKRIEKKLFEQKIEYESEIKILNEKINELKNVLSEQKEINIHLQNNLSMAIEKDIENDNEVVEMLTDLQKRNKEKEKELNKVKEFIKVKEDENKHLKVSVKQHNKTIIELESMLTGLKSDENKLKAKKNKIVELNQKIADEKRKSFTIRVNDVELSMMDYSSNKSNISVGSDIDMNTPGINKPQMEFSTSRISVMVDNEIHNKHIEQLELIKIQYNKLVNDMKNEFDELKDKYDKIYGELKRTEELVVEIENSKVCVLRNFAVEIDRMRTEIKKQHLLYIGC